MSSKLKNISLTHERDAAWLLALYLAVHGGDPAPKEGEVVTRELQQGIALTAISALSEALDERARDGVRHALAPLQKQFQMKSVDAKVAGEQLEAMGIHVTEYTGEQGTAASASANANVEFNRPRFYCFRFGGRVICIEPPPSPVGHPIN